MPPQRKYSKCIDKEMSSMGDRKRTDYHFNNNSYNYYGNSRI
ncbi:hypothetical protein HMPREF1554_01102 [Porphyromonas gingivalis F0569]|nr:hypothetical protein A343_1361 [Porphyromonas gingivalis JCVI SC001]ERJ67158.1 hypothetical protein HMPREF1554_01102 [Porphyromonas gingivalis F0569]ERJ70174.1 hypothetical protein HMPREF1553_00338 [Porphyromonas gingivalis F0568]ERJ83885.1 hypothetical protein HMPREF1989_01953 [Porphyromonas gingivalis F0566]